jgi:metal-responsive CopG/Arc/MetJ family transcriptional regulator
MPDEKKDQRIPIMMTAAEVKAVDDWSFSNRIRSRGEAIRQLVQKGLSSLIS